jgi:hypothetical protein
MVVIDFSKLAVLATALVGSLVTMAAASDPYYADDSLAARAYLDDGIDLVGRGFYDEEPLSVREYIDEQIEIAVRSYAEEFEELFARHTKEEIAKNVKHFKGKLKEAKKLLTPLVKARQAAEKAYNKDKTDENKRKKKAAQLAEDKQREIVEGNREQLEYWEGQTPSRGGSPSGTRSSSKSKSSPKKKPGKK